VPSLTQISTAIDVVSECVNFVSIKLVMTTLFFVCSWPGSKNLIICCLALKRFSCCRT